ncbi:MAG: GNAT family N-acetyltransferase [Armatimonadota bacterium]|nr:GNAT family N-acetyltransferase [Armatimonadota bacterium]MDR7464830.1 GNAT family N-acetyltransferase [Armatimonadota bacterium]MDR7540335.1 GNAT family N-acetyltransferase [Armatimonadota bacterium]
MSLSLRIIDQVEDLEGLRGPWDELASCTNAGLYQTWEWTFASARYHMATGRLHILTAWDGTRLVGVAPFVWRPHRRKLVTTCDLHPLDATHPETIELLVAEEYSSTAAEAFADHLTKQGCWDRLHIHSVPPDSIATEHFLCSMARRGHAISQEPGRSLLVVRLPSSFDEYLGRLQGKTRRELLRRSRHLSRLCVVEEVQLGQDLGQALHRFLELHDLRWRLLQRKSLLADQRLRNFYREVAQLLHERGWLRLSFLRSETGYIAADLVFWCNGRAYARQCGLDISGAWTRYSPGLVLALKNIEWAIQAGLREFRLGPGDEPYKRNFAPEVMPTSNYRIVSRALKTRAKLLFDFLIQHTRKVAGTVVAPGLTTRTILSNLGVVTTRPSAHRWARGGSPDAG